jgi:hypothetical protein
MKNLEGKSHFLIWDSVLGFAGSVSGLLWNISVKIAF